MIGVAAGITFAVASFPPRIAHADATAQALFQEARKLVADGKVTEACPKFEESLRLEPGAGTRFNLADCYEKMGRTASAWGAFRDVEDATKLAGQMARSETARARAEKLEPKLCRLDVRVAKELPDLVVERDGAVVGHGQFGASIPIDPGTHELRARAAGKKAWNQTFQVASCPGTTSLEVPALEDVPEPPPTPASVPVAPSGNPATVVSPRAPDTTVRRIAMWSSFGLAAVGVGVGVGFGVHSLAKDSEAKPLCNGQFCNSEGSAIRAQALRAGDASTAAFVAGGVFAVAGLVLLITMPSDEPARTSDLARGVLTF